MKHRLMLLKHKWLIFIPCFLGEKLAEWGFMDAQAFCECGRFFPFFSFSLTLQIVQVENRKQNYTTVQSRLDTFE